MVINVLLSSVQSKLDIYSLSLCAVKLRWLEPWPQRRSGQPSAAAVVRQVNMLTRETWVLPAYRATAQHSLAAYTFVFSKTRVQMQRGQPRLLSYMLIVGDGLIVECNIKRGAAIIIVTSSRFVKIIAVTTVHLLTREVVS